MKRDKNWLENRNATKNPKLFNVTVYRDENGNLNLVGGSTRVLDRRTDEWEAVNTRAFGDLINRQGVNTQ